jgi:hypothetical protein
MKFPRLENQPTSRRKDMLFSNLWVRPLFIKFSIPFRFMLTLVKVEFIMLCVDSNPFQELRFTLVYISTLLQTVGVDRFCMRLRSWSKKRSTECPMPKHLPSLWTLKNPSWLSIYSMTMVTQAFQWRWTWSIFKQIPCLELAKCSKPCCVVQASSGWSGGYIDNILELKSNNCYDYI